MLRTTLCDELGYLNVKTEQTNIFFKLMEERHQRKPTLISTKPVVSGLAGLPRQSRVHQGAPQPPSRRCYTVVIDGPCLRPQTG